MRTAFLTFLLTLFSNSAMAQQAPESRWPTLDGKPPVVIAHRGASGHRPEHTLDSYRLAIEMGADLIEPDLVSTRDGHLIARHEPLLDATTNVASIPKFAARKTTRIMDGESYTGFFASDFTLAEIKELRAIQPNPRRSKEFDGQFTIPTFEEILKLREEASKTGRVIGIYPETKHPAFHRALGLPLEDRMLEALARFGLIGADAPVWLQSFESANLQYLRSKSKLPIAQLIDERAISFAEDGEPRFNIANYEDTRGSEPPGTLADIARYAQALAPWKRIIIRSRSLVGERPPSDADTETLPARDLIARAHRAGLRVHTWTFRNEPSTLARNYQNDPTREYHEFFALGIDGVFSDFPDTAVDARRAFARGAK